MPSQCLKISTRLPEPAPQPRLSGGGERALEASPCRGLSHVARHWAWGCLLGAVGGSQDAPSSPWMQLCDGMRQLELRRCGARQARKIRKEGAVIPDID
eukprot:424063-Hanusia_phi.AAC.1